jgi:fumarylpyruvate hydrolase
MSSFVFPPQQASVAIRGSQQRFPVHRIYCVGRNYAEHVREMGANPERDAPFFFCKPADAVVSNHSSIPFPSSTQDLHHEVELVVAIGEAAEKLSIDRAEACIFGYSVGIDLTRRDLQAQAKQHGRPWDTAKGFDHSAPIADIVAVADCGLITDASISLSVNGEVRQRGKIADLIWSIPEILVELSHLFSLQPGDLIFTGTPAGVGRLVPGDELCGEVTGLDELQILIGN